MSYFFLSHAQGDDDRYVEEFFADLCTEVAVLLHDDRTTPVGFLGSTAAHSEGDWPAGVADAVANCRVFVALGSPRYFLNATCGRHWWLFSERQRRFQDTRDGLESALMPVLWASTKPEPDVAPDLITPDRGDARRGLRQLIRLRSRRHQYLRFVAWLAERIVTAAEPPAAPAYGPVPPPEVIPNAFLVGRAAGDPARATGDIAVRFVVAAGRRAEMNSVRTDVEFYGERGEDWAPYRPQRNEPLATQAQAVASERLLASEVTDLNGLATRPNQASDSEAIVVLLVDPWSMRLDEYRRALSEADRASTGAAAVMMPTNVADVETRRNLDELTYGVLSALHNSAARPEVVFRADVSTPNGFDADLAGVLEGAKNRIFRTRPAETDSGARPRARPILQGP